MSEEVLFPNTELIVSRTDTRGVIQYANQTFLDVSGYSEAELLGRPHSIIRHPDMPRCVFKLLWQEIQAGNEIFAFVKNACKNGGHYWVLAYVTPDWDAYNRIVGYFSVRRMPSRAAVEQIAPIYERLCRAEAQHSSKIKGIEASTGVLTELLERHNTTYSELVYALQQGLIL